MLLDKKTGFYIIDTYEERDLYADASASRAFSFLDPQVNRKLRIMSI